MKIAYLSSIILALILTTGCHRHGRVVVHDTHRPVHHNTHVVIKPAHSCVHHGGCGHVWNGGSWIVVRGHRHGHGCGHYYHGGRWSVNKVQVHSGPHHKGVRVRSGNTTVGVHKGPHSKGVHVKTGNVNVKVKKYR